MDRSRPASRLTDHLDGPPLRLPPALDRLAERWAGARPRARTLLATLAVLTVVVLTGRGAATSPWGQPRPVVTAARDLPAGHLLGPGDLRAARWPEAVVPDGAPSGPGDAEGRVLAAGLPAGALLTGGHLDVAGLGHDLDPDRVAFPLPLAEGTSLHAGQRVDVVAGDGSGEGARIAVDARVLAVDDATAWLDVARDEAPGLAGASAYGALTAVIVSPNAG